MDVTITTLAERPELIPLVWQMPDSWPEFMNHDLISTALFTPLAEAFRDLAVVATDADGTIVAHGTAIALQLGTDGRRELPDNGWDGTMVWAWTDLYRGIAPDTACALETSVHTAHAGQGLSIKILAALRDAAEERGLASMVAPV